MSSLIHVTERRELQTKKIGMNMAQCVVFRRFVDDDHHHHNHCRSQRRPKGRGGNKLKYFTLEVKKAAEGVYLHTSKPCRPVKIEERSLPSVPDFPDTPEGNRLLWDTILQDRLSLRDSNYAYNESPAESRLPGMLEESAMRDLGLAGINTSYIYHGYPCGSTALHVEDFNADSYNLLLSGSDKLVMVIGKEHREGLGVSASAVLEGGCCRMIVDHKTLFLTTDFLARAGIHFELVRQRARDLVHFGRGVIHAVLNLGRNVAEAVNHGSKAWLLGSASFSSCQCLLQRYGSCQIAVDPFVARRDLVVTNIDARTVRLHSCASCDFSHPNKRELAKHEAERHRRKCGVCGRTFVRKHKCTGVMCDFVCVTCGSVFRRDTLRKHILKSGHAANVAQHVRRKKYACLRCRAAYGNVSKLVSHVEFALHASFKNGLFTYGRPR